MELWKYSTDFPCFEICSQVVFEAFSYSPCVKQNTKYFEWFLACLTLIIGIKSWSIKHLLSESLLILHKKFAKIRHYATKRFFLFLVQLYLKWKFHFNGCASLHFPFRFLNDNKCFHGEISLWEPFIINVWLCLVLILSIALVLSDFLHFFSSMVASHVFRSFLVHREKFKWLKIHSQSK